MVDVDKSVDADEATVKVAVTDWLRDHREYPAAPADVGAALSRLADRARRVEELEAELLRLTKAVEAWDAQLSSWCDMPERDAVREAIVAAAALPRQEDTP